jgi:putative GTP pyrophosphokinase
MALSNEELASLKEWYAGYTDKLKAGLHMFDQLVEELKDQTSDKVGRKFIEEHSSRIKEFDSAFEKCKRKGEPQTKDGLKRLTDLAGARIVVDFEDNIKLLAEVLLAHERISLVGESNYLSAKDSGYRAYHLDILFRTDDNKEVPIEIQIRTLLMDAWADLDHSIRYKPTVPIMDEKKCNKYFKIFGKVLFELDRDLMDARDMFDGIKKANDID